MSKFTNNIKNGSHGVLNALGLNYLENNSRFGSKTNTITPGAQGDINMVALFAGLALGLYDIGNINPNTTPDRFYETIKGSKSKSIYCLTKNIFSTLSETKTILISIRDILKTNNKSNVSTNISNSSEKTSMMVSTQEIKFDEKSAKAFNNIIDGIIKLLSASNIDDANIRKFKDIIGNNKSDLNELFTNISSIINGGNNITGDIEKIGDALNLLNSILDIKKINRKSLDYLAKETGENGTIDIIFKNIIKLCSSEVTLNKNINILKNIFESLSVVANIGLIQRQNIKKSVKFIKNDIIDSLKEIIEKINDISGGYNELEISISNLTSIFNCIADIPEIGLKKRLLLRRNILFFKNYLLDSIISILNSLIKVSNNANKEGNEALTILNNLFNTIFKVVDFNFITLIKLDFKLRYLESIIRQNIFESLLQSIIKESSNIKNSEGSLEDLNDFFFTLGDLVEFINNMDLKSTGFKLLFINKSIIGNIINTIELYNNLLSGQQINLDSLNNIKVFFEKFISVSETILKIKYKELYKNLNDLDELIVLMSHLEDLPDEKHLTNFQNSLTEILSAFSLYNNTELSQILVYCEDNIEKVNNIVISLNDIIKKWPTFNKDTSKLSEFLNDGLATIVESFSSKGSIGKNLNQLSFTKGKLENFKNIEEFIDILVKINERTILFKNNPLQGLENSTESLVNIINKFKNVKQENVDKANTAVKGLLQVITISAAVLLIGALAMTQIKLSNLIMFTVVLSAFIYGISTIFSKINLKDVELNIDTVKSLIIFIGGCAAILLIGSYAMNFIEPAGLLLFSVVLGVFLLGVSTAIRIASKNLKELKQIISDYIDLITVCAGLLIFGSLIMKIINLGDITLFIGGLFMMIVGTGTAFYIINELFDGKQDILKNIHLFSESVLLLGMTLTIGSLISSMIGLDKVFGFTTILSGFIIIMGGIFWGLSKFAGDKKVFDDIKKFGEMVALCGAILVLGSLLSAYLSFESLMKFTGALMLFVTLTMLPFLIFKKISSTVFVGARDFAILMGISTAVMLVGSLFVKDFERVKNSILFGLALGGFILIITFAFKFAAKEIKSSIGTALGFIVLVTLSTLLLYIGAEIMSEKDTVENALIFVGVMALFIGGMGLILGLMGHFWKEIGLGLLCAVGIMAIMVVGGMLVLYINQINKEVSWGDVLEGVGKIFAVIILAGLAIGVIGGILLGTGGLAAGVLIVGAIAVLGISFVTRLAAKTVKEIIEVTKDLNTEGAKTSIDKLFDTLGYIASKMVHIFDTEKTTGFGIFNGLVNTSKKIKKGIELMGAIAVYKQMGEMLAVLAEGVKCWAVMKIPTKFDDKGKPTGFTTLADKDLTQMSNNILRVLLSLGLAITSVYDSAQGKEIFEKSWGGLGNSPFEIIVKSMSKTGVMLSSIALGVQQWANLKVPTEFDKNGKPKGYISLSDKVLTQCATNIQNVLEAIGNALVNTVKQNPEIFKDGGLFKDSPIMNAAKAMKLMGETLNLTAHVIGCYASGKFPQLDKEGKLTSYVDVTEQSIWLAGYKIQTVLECIGNAIKNTVNNPENQDIFKDSLATNAPAMVAAKAINQMASALNTIIDVLSKLKDLKLEDLNLENTKKKIGDIVKWAIEVLNIFTKKEFLVDGKNIANTGRGNGAWDKIVNWWSGDQTVGDYINENLPGMEKSINGINNIAKNITNVVQTLNELGKQIASNNLSAINDSNKKLLIEKIGKIIDIQNSIRSIGDNKLVNLNRYIIYNDKVINVIKKITDVVKQYDNLIKIINESKAINKSKLNNFFTLSKTVNNIAQSLNINYGKTNSKHFDLLCEGLKKIYSTFNEFEETKGFKSYANDVSNFIEKINSLDLNKLSQMNSLIKSMNELASKMNGLDKLSEALSDNLTLVLRELLYQLQKAEASINNAHKLQEKRRELIQDSIYKIKNIMDKHMIVEVYNKSEDNNTDYKYASLNGSTISPSTSTSSTSTNSVAESVSSTPELTSPENAGSTELSKNTESNKDETLTKDAFINLMRQHMKLWDA